MARLKIMHSGQGKRGRRRFFDCVRAANPSPSTAIATALQNSITGWPKKSLEMGFGNFCVRILPFFSSILWHFLSFSSLRSPHDLTDFLPSPPTIVWQLPPRERERYRVDNRGKRLLNTQKCPPPRLYCPPRNGWAARAFSWLFGLTDRATPKISSVRRTDRRRRCRNGWGCHNREAEWGVPALLRRETASFIFTRSKSSKKCRRKSCSNNNRGLATTDYDDAAATTQLASTLR